jgi:hypothetical protein
MKICKRKECLLILKKLLQNERDKICEALNKDLKKPFFESYYLMNCNFIWTILKIG